MFLSKRNWQFRYLLNICGNMSVKMSQMFYVWRSEVLIQQNGKKQEQTRVWVNKFWDNTACLLGLSEQFLDNVCHSCFGAEHSGNWFMLSQHDVRITALLSVIGTFRQCWAKYSSTEQIIHQMNMNGKSIPFIAIKVRYLTYYD